MKYFELSPLGDEELPMPKEYKECKNTHLKFGMKGFIFIVLFDFLSI